MLWPQRAKLDQAVINDSDFAGPILFALVLGTLLLFVSVNLSPIKQILPCRLNMCYCVLSQKGKVYFGSIYVVFVTGLVSLWAVLNLMSSKGIDVYRTASIMGYCLLPIVFLAALSVPIDLQGTAGVVLVPTAVAWCTNAAALFFVVALEADDRRWYAGRSPCSAAHRRCVFPISPHPNPSRPHFSRLRIGIVTAPAPASPTSAPIIAPF